MRTYACVVGILTFVLALAAFTAGCGKQEEPVSEALAPAEGAETTRATTATVEPEIAQKFCPVMGGAIDKDIHIDYEGRRVYFCCQMCVDTFKKDPDKYLAKLDAQLQTETAP